MSGASPSSPPPSGPVPPPPERRVVRRRGSRLGLYVGLVVVVVVIVVGAGLGTSWYGLKTSSSTPAPGACPAGVTLSGDGAQIVEPLMDAWESAYFSQTSNQINYPASGSGTGLSEFTSGHLDFAVTDDPLSSAEAKAMPTQALTLPFIGGALTIIYNLAGVTTLNLTGPLLAEIYNGTITQWNDPAIQAVNHGVTLPSATIYTVHRSDAAGTTYVLSDFLSQSSTYWAKNIGKGISIAFPSAPKQTGVKGNSLMISTVANTADTIGYSDLTDVLAATSPPQYAAIENPAKNFIRPTIANTVSAIADKVASMAKIPASSGNWWNVSMVNANGTLDYPLATFIFMYVYQATDKGFSPTLSKSQVLVQWLLWTLSTTAQKLASESQPTQLYYATLPNSILSVDKAGIQTMTFNKAAIPSCS